jgi:DNA invertase Pin-like site-specific DNA recombinase
MVVSDKNYGYCRCSTNDGKQDVDYQVKELLDMGVGREYIYLEYESGAREDRPEFKKVLTAMFTGDSLYVTDITRISRSTKQLYEVIDYINNNKMRLVIGNLDIDCRSVNIEPMVEGMLKMMAVFAELDRKIKIYQINLGLKNARKEGRIGGRPRTSTENIPDIFYRYYPQYKNGYISKLELGRLTLLSMPTIYKYISFVENKNN